MARGTSKGKKPPGPRGLPLIGNVLQLSDENWLTFTEWKFKYGPIVGLNLGGKNTIVLNTHKAASDLLDKRASIYSDRPRFIVAQEMLCGGLLLVFTRYGDMWRRMRRAAHEGLYSHAAENYYTLQETEATVLVDGILKTPDSWDDHLKRTAASQIMAMVYDTLPIKNHEEPLITRVNDLVQRLVKAAYPGEHLVEFFPFLNSLPEFLTPWKKWADEWHRKDSQLFMDYYTTVRDRVLAGDERPSLVSSLVKRAEESNFTEREKAWVAGVMISAGAETTAAVMAWFFLAMTLYPEVQRKAQEEIDIIVGRDRMPNFDDLESMPYLRALVREILRWRPVDPIGLQHQSMEDDVYEGYFIPKGTLVIFNVWAMNRDPELYGEDFDAFRPDRFLNEDGQLKPTHPTTKGEGHVTYGFGRRICVGRYVANNTLFIDIAHILWACKIEKAKNFDGTDVKYNDHANLKEGLVVRPAPFRNVIKPRFAEAPKIVAEQKERLIAAASVR
ncbi:cytochrome P450 [Crepidotus variabilis]|uniref:Cytochrome P450 n=1 Tax=Crepidotus variabilis TaxID=179855 RepID=A0A9P6EA70_9AGAR|nr:cytochrome P450 [Crepidotus variabilis]